jgi:hypothetical protein
MCHVRPGGRFFQVRGSRFSRVVRWIRRVFGEEIRVGAHPAVVAPGLRDPLFFAAITGSPASGDPVTPGALSEVLVMEYLVQETDRPVDPILWKDSDSDRLLAQVHGVKLELQEFNTRTGHFLSLTLTYGEHTARLTEPAQPPLFGRTKGNEDHRKVALLLVTLHKLAAAQIARRRQEAIRNQDQIRQSLFRRLIFGDGGKSPRD